jgi:hypothetical protein
MSDVPTEEQAPDDTAERQQRYDSFREEVSKRQLSNAENFDKSILTYSSAGLAFSLGFLKDYVAVGRAAQLWMLYGSWALFSLAILLVVASYPLSQQVLDIQLARAHEYYCDRREEAYDEKTAWELTAIWFTSLAGFAFFIALVLTTLFVSLNLRNSRMADIEPMVRNDGVTGLSMQKQGQANQNVEKGATALPLQRVTPAPVPPQQPQPPATGTGNKGQ